MTRFLTQDSPIPPYMAFPRFLLDKDGLNETAKMCYNFPFAFFTQLFFIQPFIRTVFKFLFRKDIASRKEEWA